MALFESYDRRIDHINAVLKEYGINGIEDAKAICDAKGIDPYTMCKETQPICFENACWAYVVGAAIAIKKGCTNKMFRIPGWSRIFRSSRRCYQDR